MVFDSSAFHMIEETDLRIDVYRSGYGGLGRTGAIRITHIPSGLVLSSEFGEGCQHKSPILAKAAMLKEMEGIVGES